MRLSMRLVLDPFSPSGVSLAPAEPKRGKQSHGYIGTKKLAELDEVSITTTPSDNQALAYDTATGKWIPQTISGGGGGGAVDSVNGATGDVVLTQDDIADGTTYKQYSATEKTKLAAISGTNTGDQTSIVGITGTKAQFDTAVTDGNILYVGDVTQYTDEMARDALGTALTAGAGITITPNDGSDTITIAATGGGGGGTVDTIVAGTNIDVDSTDPANPIVSVESLTTADITDLTATATELNYTDGVTSSIQTQLDGKSATGHTHVAADVTDFSTAADARISNAAGSTVASLSGGKVPTSQLPAISLTTVQTAASQVAQLALTAQEGDVVVRTDENKTYMHNGGTAGTMADYTLLNTPTDAVTSVNGDTGVVVLDKTDVGLGNVDNTSDATKNSAAVSLTNKDLTSGTNTFPTFNQNTTGSAATLTTPRAIYGNNFDGSAALTQIVASTYGGTGNGFTKFAGPATTEKTFTLPNATATILTDNAAVTVAQGGTGRSTSTTAYGLIAAGTTATGALQTLPVGGTADVLMGGGVSALPVWTSSTGVGNVVRATSPVLTTPNLGTPSAVTLTNGTGLPVSGITASTATALGVGSVELGHATDTTLSRSSAGVLAVEGVAVPTISSTSTITNKDLTSSTNTFPATTLGYAERTTDFAVTSTTFTDVTSLSVTVTVPSGGRRIKITAQPLAISNSIANVGTYVQIVESSTVLGGSTLTSHSSAGGYTPVTTIATTVPSAGSHTYKVQVKSDSGALTYRTGTGVPAFILVELI